MRRARSLAFACLFAVAGCGSSSGGPGGSGGGDVSDHGPEGAFFASLPSGAAQLATVCARHSHDAVAARFCASSSPGIGSIVDLEHAVGLFDDGPPQFALTGASTSLVSRVGSSSNPRAILFTAPAQAPTTQANDGSFIAD